MAEQILKRSEIEEKYKWDLSPMVLGDKDFDEKMDKVLGEIPKIGGFKGKLNDKVQLLECLKLNSSILRQIVRLYAYAEQKKDENTLDTKANANSDRANSTYVKFAFESSFITPELTNLPESYLREVIEDKDFANFDIEIMDVLRVKPHTLSEKEESLLAMGGEVFGSFSDIFGMTDNADLKFGTVKNENGEDVELSHSRYGLLLSSDNREVRRDAYEKYYSEYKKLIHTIAQTYIGSVKKDVFLSRARKFNSSLEYSMFYENADKVVYENLLKNVEKALPTLHQYISLRKKTMNLSEIHFYDLYVTLVENSDLKVSFDKAYELVEKALKPLGEDYVKQLEIAKNDRWIDVYNNEGKRSGAYSNAIYGVHPYVLLNYEKTVHDVFTIAHEMGHAMHSFYSNNNQVFEKADYTIFVAEVASTVNEVLLLRYLIDNTEDVNMKKFCLNYFLDMFRTTLFRQTMFAEFEYIAHDYCEKGVPLEYKLLSDEYEKLNKKYYGEEIIHDDCIRYEWARIPHFYRSFYVYKYATGITSAISIAYNILEKGEEAVAKYKEFLKSGCTQKPVDLLKIAGIDLTTNEPFENANRVFQKTLKELEQLL